MDIFSPEKRSDIMRHIKGRNTKPEMIVRRYLFSKGFRYRVNVKRLPGKPDIVLRKYHTVIFVHGCFWHGHENCKLASHPQSHSDYWESKIARNKQRDAETREKLKTLGWNTMVIWECQLKSLEVRRQTLEGVVALLDEAFLDLNRLGNVSRYDLGEHSESRAAEEAPSYGKNR